MVGSFPEPFATGSEGKRFPIRLVCAGGDPLGCGRCDACRRAVTFSEERPASPIHPDVTIIEKGFYPPETIGRSRPELQEISVDQVRTIVLAHAAYAPHEGRARVFIVRRAEELSVSAANALLKTLEGKLVGEIGTRTRQAGVPLHAIVGSDALDAFGKRIIDLQFVRAATDLAAIEAAGEDLGHGLAGGAV